MATDRTKEDLVKEIGLLKKRIEILEKAGPQVQLYGPSEGDARFRQAMESVPFPLMVYAEDGEVLLLSKAWTDMSGYAIQDIPTVDELLKKAMGTKNGLVVSYVDKVHASKNKVEDGDYTLITKSGEKRMWYFNSASLEKLPDGRRTVVSIATDITERKLAEKTLQETVWLMHMIIYRTGDGVTISDMNGHFEVYNSRMQEITGYSIDEANNSGDFSILVYPDKKERKVALDRLADIIKGKTFEEVETIVQAKDGSKKTLLVMSSMIRYKNREMFLSIYRDITEHRKADQAIAIFQKFAFNSGQGLGMADMKGNITYANSALCRIFDEKNIEDVVGKNIRKFYPQEWYKRLETEILPSVLNGKQWIGESMLISSKGREVPVIENIFLIKDEHGNAQFFANVITDITEQKNAERRIRESEERLSAIFRNMHEGILIADTETKRFWDFNEMMCRMLGYDPEELRKLSVVDIHPSEAVPELLKQFDILSRKGAELVKDAPVKKKDGSIFYADITAAPIMFNGRRYTAGFFRDTTERKRSEEAIKDALAMTSKANAEMKSLYKALELKNAELQRLDNIKNEFVSTVSHEIRTPLSITKEGIDLIMEGVAGPLNSKQADILATARVNMNRLARIITDLLDVSKMESGKLDIKKNEVDLLSLAHHVITLLEPTAKAKGLMIEQEFLSAPVLVMGDGDMLVQVLTNLLDNAIKFTEKGYVGIRIHATDGLAECTVYDSGIGISKQNLPKVFNKFEQFRRTVGAGGKGTGLGLFIVKWIVEAHGGRIWAESTYGEGASFTFVLPKM